MQSYLKVSCMAACAIALSGCLSYTRPPRAVDSSSLSTLQAEEKGMLPADVKVLTLEKAQEIALANNPSFQSVQIALHSARTRYYQSFSKYAPTLNAGISFQQSFGNITSSSSGEHPRTQSDGVSPSLSGQWLIFDSLQREMNILQQKYALSQSSHEVEDARRLLIRATAYAFNDVQLAFAQREIVKATIVCNRELLADAERKYKVGTVSLSDVLNFRVNLRNGELSLEKIDYTINSSRYVLAAYLGLTDGTIPESIEFPAISRPENKYTSGVEIYLDQALANRPDLRAMRDQLQATRYAYYGTLGKFGPTFTANYSWGWNESRGISHVSTGSNHSWSGGSNFSWGISGSWNLFNGLSDYFSVRMAADSVAMQDYLLYQAWLSVITDVRTAYENYRTSVAQADLSREICELTRETRDLVKNEYLAGTALVTRFNEAERDLVQAQNNLATAVVNISNAKAQLDAAVYSLGTPAAPAEPEQQK